MCNSKTISLRLTSAQKQRGHFLKNRELILYINGIRYDDYLSHNERVQCLNLAIVKFDNDLLEAAENFKHHKYGAYLWLYTPDFMRGEEISGLLRLLYLIEIIKYLSECKKVKQLHIEVPFAPWVKQQLKNRITKIHYNRLVIIKNGIHQLFQVTKDIYRLNRFNLRMLFSKSNPPFDGTLIDTSTKFRKNRYDDIHKVNVIFDNKVRYYSGDQLEVKGIDKNLTVVFKRELNLEIIFLSFLVIFKLSLFLYKQRSKIPSTIYYNHKGFYKLMLYWDLILAQKSIDKYLSKSNIRTIVQVSTLTKPLYRSLIAAARKRQILFIQVASRSLTRMRNSERLLNCDINEYNNTALPDAFVFKDKYSVKIFDDFPTLQKKVYIGSKFLMKENTIDDNGDRKKALYLLFNHREDVSFKMLNSILNAGILELFDTIIYRCHPNFTFNKETINQAFKSKVILDNTGKDYLELRHYQVFAISGPTSAALEAISSGALIFWASFIYDDAILMEEVMETIGLKCNSNIELMQVIKLYYSDNSKYKYQLNSDISIMRDCFYTKDQISDQILSIIHRIRI